VDVGISYDEADISAGLKTQTLAVVPPHVVVPYDHPFAEMPSIPISALIDQTLILLDLPSSRQYYTSLFETAGFQPKFTYKTGNYEMIRSMVGAGIGFAILQTCPPIDYTQSGTRVICKPIRENLRKSRLVVAYTQQADRKSTRLNSSHVKISYAVFCLKKKKKYKKYYKYITQYSHIYLTNLRKTH